MAKVWDFEQLKSQRRQGTIEANVPFVLNGRTEEVQKKIVNGEMELIELDKPIGEMMSSAASRKELMQKVVLDVELGREAVPLLYAAIYERLQDANFPREFEAKWAQYGAVVFAEHLEGGEVKFGSLTAEQGPIAYIKGYAAGFEYTKEMELFNQTFNFEILNRAFGEANNAILNHLHLGPIIEFAYKAANKTAAKYTNGAGEASTASDAHYILSLRETIRQGLTDSRTAKRPASILLAASAHKESVMDAIGAMTVNGSNYRPLEISDVVFYDGWEGSFGKKKAIYPGAPMDKAYLIRPKRGFKELIKQDLQINSTMGDLTRLVQSQVVGDFWRGVFAAVEENVQEITLPAQP